MTMDYTPIDCLLDLGSPPHPEAQLLASSTKCQCCDDRLVTLALIDEHGRYFGLHLTPAAALALAESLKTAAAEGLH